MTTIENNLIIGQAQDYPNPYYGYAMISLVVDPALRANTNMTYTPDFGLPAASCHLRLENSRYQDFVVANRALGQAEYGGYSRPGFTLHHCYNPNMGPNHDDYIMEEVDRDVHRHSCPHLGAYRQARLLGLRTCGVAANQEVEWVPFCDDYTKRKLTETQEADIDKQFDLLEGKMKLKFSDDFRNFYKDMRFTGSPDVNIRVKTDAAETRDEYIDIAWLCPLDLEDKNGLYQIYTTENCLIDGVQSSEEMMKRQWLEYAETTDGNIFYTEIKNGYVSFENIVYYDHEQDIYQKIADGITDFESSLFLLKEINDK